MNVYLERAINAVAKERNNSNFDEAFEAASRLVTEFGEADLARRIVTQVPDSVPWEVVADLLGILVWSTDDNGSAIDREAERWLLEGTDLRKIQIALNLECFPFIDADQMYAVLREVSARHREVAARCEDLIRQRQAIRE